MLTLYKEEGCSAVAPTAPSPVPSTTLVLRSGYGFVFPRSKGHRSSLLYYQNQSSCLQKFTLGQFRRASRTSPLCCPSLAARTTDALCIPAYSNLSWNTTDDTLQSVSLTCYPARRPPSRVSSACPVSDLLSFVCSCVAAPAGVLFLRSSHRRT